MYLWTSEFVSNGHPDKLADQISDAVLDAYLAEDPGAKVACDVAVTKGFVLMTGEVRSRHHPDVEQIARTTHRHCIDHLVVTLEGGDDVAIPRIEHSELAGAGSRDNPATLPREFQTVRRTEPRIDDQPCPPFF